MRRIIAKGLAGSAVVVVVLGLAGPALAAAPPGVPLTPAEMAALSVHQGCVFFNAWLRWGNGDPYDGGIWLDDAARLHGLAGSLEANWAPLAATTAAIDAAWITHSRMHFAALSHTETVCVGVTSF